jgi:hypothetical protein
VPYWTPHTATYAGQGYVGGQSNRWYNNIFIQKGSNQISTTVSIHGNAPPIVILSDYNVMYQGAQKLTGKDQNSIVNAFAPNLTLTTLDTGVTIKFSANTDPTTVKCPLISNAYLGKFLPANIGIEAHDAGPITVDRDIVNIARNATNPTAGPFEKLQNGANSFTIVAGPKQQGSVAIRPSFTTNGRTVSRRAEMITIKKAGSALRIFLATPHSFHGAIISARGTTVCAFSGTSTGAIDLSSYRLAPGLYFVRVESRYASCSVKIVWR